MIKDKINDGIRDDQTTPPRDNDKHIIALVKVAAGGQKDSLESWVTQSLWMSSNETSFTNTDKDGLETELLFTQSLFDNSN